MQVRPLPNDLAVRPRIIDLILGYAREVIGGHVADAVAAGLDRMHLHGRKLGENVGNILQPGPVELQVLAGREMPEAAVIAMCDVAELPQLPRAEQAVGNRDTEHWRMALDVQAIAKAQKLEFVVGQLAGKKAPRLIPEFGYALIYEGLVELIVLVHAPNYRLRACTPRNTLWL